MDGRQLRYHWRIQVGVFLLILLCITPCSGQEAEIESVIPAYSATYTAVENVPGIWDAVAASPSWQAFFLSYGELVGASQEIQAITDSAKELLGIDLRTLVSVFGGRMAFVKVYVDVGVPVLPAIIADVGDSEDAVEIIRKIEEKLASDEGYEVRSPAGTYQTVSFSSIRPVGSGPTIRYVFLDNLFVIALDQDTFEAILNVYLGEAPSLVYDPRFNKTRAGISAEGEVFGYANMELLWPTVRRSMWLSELKMPLQMLETKSIAWTANLLTPNREQQMYIYTGADSGLMAPLFAEHGPLISPHIIPAANADIFFAVNLGDPVAAWERFGDTVKSVIGERDYAQMQGGVAEFEQHTTLSLRDDILSSLTGEIGFAAPNLDIRYIEAPRYLMRKGLLVFFGVSDSERCAMSIKRVFSTAEVQLQQTEYRGVQVYHVSALSGQNSPAGYMFAGGLLIFGSIQTLHNIVDEEMPLAASEKFANIISQLPQRLGLMYYIDLEWIGEMLLAATPVPQSGDDLMRLQTLDSTGGTLIYDGEGLKVRAVGTSAKSWLETIGILAERFIYIPF